MISSLKKLFSLFSNKDRKNFLFLLLMMNLGALVEMIGIGSIPAFIYLISSPDSFFETFGVLGFLSKYFNNNPEQFFIFASILLILLFLVKNLFVSVVHYYKTKLSFKQQYLFSSRLFRVYSYAPWSFHAARNSAEILRNVNNETNLAVNNVLIPFISLVMDIILIILIFALLFFVDPLVSFITLVGFGFGSIIFVFFTSRKLKEFGKDEIDQRRTRNKIVLQTLGDIKELKIYNKIDFFLRKHYQSAVKTSQAQAYKQITAFMPKPFLEVFAVSGIFVVSIVFISRGRDFSNIIPVLALFGTAAIKVIPALKQVLLNFTLIRFNHFAVIPIYNDITALEKAGYQQKSNEELPEIAFSKNIKVESLNYKYADKAHSIINNLSVKIEKGGFYVLSGDSGTGKTTFLNLLTGILPPDKGKIIVDGQNIENNITSWQSAISYVPQNVFLFDDTIKNNIAPGLFDEKIDHALLENALEVAQMKDFISSFPDGINTKIGERGIKISGGQRQRIGVARAIYHQPKLLILDEALSEVDKKTEKKIIEKIREIDGLTIIFVGHKYSEFEGITEIKIG